MKIKGLSNQKESRIRQAVYGEPWLIMPDKLEVIADIAERFPSLSEAEAQEQAAAAGGMRNPRKTMSVEDGIAVVNVNGPMMRYANLFTQVSGATSIEVLRGEIQAALNNPDVRGILLNIDSPGGQVSGLAELADTIYAGRSKKPIVAYASSLAASAAYWVGSAASYFVADPTAEIGSIGVVMSWVDNKDQMARAGVYERKMISSQSPMKQASPDTERGASAIQSRLDALAQQFIDTVARNRGVGSSTVAENFGQGDVMMASAAKQCGMIDAVGYFDDAMSYLQGRAGVKRTVSASNNNGYNMNGGDPVSELNPTSAAAIEAGAEVLKGLEASNDVLKTELDQIKRQLAIAEAEKAELAVKVDAIEAEKAAIEKAQKEARLDALAADFVGDKSGHLAVLNALGEGSKEFDFYVSHNRAVAAQIKDSDLFKEFGSDNDAQAMSAEEEVEQKITKLLADKPELSRAQAATAVYTANPELYNRLQTKSR